MDTDQKLFFQHTVEWLPAGLPDEGKIIIFNNGRGRTPEEYSSVVILNPFDEDGNYYLQDGSFGPESFISEYTAPIPTDFYASFISSAQQLPNGNLLINNGPVGTFFEVDTDGMEVWKYINPVSTTAGIVDQGADINGNLAFRATKYPLDYPAFSGRNLDQVGHIEGNAIDLDQCITLSVADNNKAQFLIYPNPTSSKLFFKEPLSGVSIFNISGELQFTTDNIINEIDVNTLSPGIYLLHSKKGVNKFQVKRN